MQKVVLSKSGNPAPLHLFAEKPYKCNTHIASRHHFCSLQILLPLTETESIQERCKGQGTDPALRQAECLSEGNEWHHHFVQDKQLCVLWSNEQ